MEKKFLEREKSEDVECDDSEDHGYSLRKRRRLGAGTTSASPYVYKRAYKRKNPIMHMPTEVVQRILSYISNEELAVTVRLVNHRFRLIAQFILNNNFKRLSGRLEFLKKMIINSIHHTQDDIEMRFLCKMLSSLEILIFYHSIIRSTVWRHMYFQHTSNLCMYAGSILDLYNVLLRQFVAEPHKIYSAAILRDYSVSREVKSLCGSVKAFVLYFDRISEMPVNANNFCSGCKVLDILDCATDATKTIVSQKLIGNTVVVKLRYYFTNAWFVALDIPEDKPKLWNEQQRLMYMRLRRIVISHSEMNMEYHQFKREVVIRTNPISRIRRPINSVYTGYGEVGTKFFYYGVMNEGAYFNKFDLNENSFQEMVRNINFQTKPPFLGLHISIELRCPLQLAPYKILEAYQKHVDGIQERLFLTANRRARGIFDLKIDFECFSARYPRLPTFYSCHLREQR